MRLFCAIELPEGTREKLAAAQAELPSAGIKFVEKENLHITLSFFGEVDEKNLQKLQSALSLAKFPPLPISIIGIGAFPDLHRPSVIFAKAQCAGLTDLAKRINAEVQNSKIPIRLDKKPFHAHITLARAKGKAGIAAFAQKSSSGNFGSFVAKEFVLKKSVLSRAGAKHGTIAAYPAESR